MKTIIGYREMLILVMCLVDRRSSEKSRSS